MITAYRQNTDIIIRKKYFPVSCSDKSPPGIYKMHLNERMQMGVGRPFFIKDASPALKGNFEVGVSDCYYYTSELFQIALPFPNLH